jgi:hypothetical protein
MCFTICFTSRTKKQIDNANNEETIERIKKSMRFRSISRQLNVLYRN